MWLTDKKDRHLYVAIPTASPIFGRVHGRRPLSLRNSFACLAPLPLCRRGRRRSQGMTIARRRLVEPGKPGWFHCISRCVRRAFLCGDGCAHRRDWVEERLRLLAGCFAVELGAYAVMSNHLHVVVRVDPLAAGDWTDLAVAQRWCAVYPSQYRTFLGST